MAVHGLGEEIQPASRETNQMAPELFQGVRVPNRNPGSLSILYEVPRMSEASVDCVWILLEFPAKMDRHFCDAYS